MTVPLTSNTALAHFDSELELGFRLISNCYKEPFYLLIDIFIKAQLPAGTIHYLFNLLMDSASWISFRPWTA